MIDIEQYLYKLFENITMVRFFLKHGVAILDLDFFKQTACRICCRRRRNLRGADKDTLITLCCVCSLLPHSSF